MQDILKSNTPAFVFDTAALKKRVAQIKEIVGETVSLCYSMKANPFFVPAMITQMPAYYFLKCLACKLSSYNFINLFLSIFPFLVIGISASRKAILGII